ncbi:Glu/Leu/Phe/Val dehydrogenase dimerization domain-containing protein [Actinophytocola algeriensis]|uniref:Leucine dehydrogenase n=1 Tax=Actinophytocola algeriensis TaxID=1768010 RepID=A0A7W7Q909_9PSEU|nr:Glu/Leu/Phe/Val dehydrogenase dimerization domain-containing protein [Actinophytocola algeriensis]MBB4909108.1 leucine dehydrogenase [Actinophytocola algeriensis]MBE1474504.1 leucine dehydrogenase [Actinophytocola algeriensis]
MVESSWEHAELVTRLGRRSGVPVTVAVHSRTLGPAAGGIRLKQYPSWQDGQLDALRLAKGMTYKNAVAGVPFGGGKSVISVPSSVPLTASLRADALADLGELIVTFDGSYLAGPDIGTSPSDMAYLRRFTDHVFCLPESAGGTGSSSGPTASGVLAALRAGAEAVFGSPSVAGRRVVVVGMGSVGSLLARALADDGASVAVADVDASRCAGYERVPVASAYAMEADVLVPSAIGGVVDASVRAPLVVGPANNQLVHDEVATALAAEGVTWVPDFVASAGGVIYTLTREAEGLDRDAAMARVAAIGDTVTTLLTNAAANGSTPLAEALALAEQRLGALV